MSTSRRRALAAPFAEVGGEEAYPTLELKGGALPERARPHYPRPDGNKRAAFLLTVLLLERNGRDWAPPDETVRRVAARELEIEQIVSRISRRSEPR